MKENKLRNFCRFQNNNNNKKLSSTRIIVIVSQFCSDWESGINLFSSILTYLVWLNDHFGPSIPDAYVTLSLSILYVAYLKWGRLFVSSDEICSSFIFDKCDYCCSSLFRLVDCKIHLLFLTKKRSFLCPCFLQIHIFENPSTCISSTAICRTRHSGDISEYHSCLLSIRWRIVIFF